MSKAGRREAGERWNALLERLEESNPSAARLVRKSTFTESGLRRAVLGVRSERPGDIDAARRHTPVILAALNEALGPGWSLEVRAVPPRRARPPASPSPAQEAAARQRSAEAASREAEVSRLAAEAVRLAREAEARRRPPSHESVAQRQAFRHAERARVADTAEALRAERERPKGPIGGQSLLVDDDWRYDT